MSLQAATAAPVKPCLDASSDERHLYIGGYGAYAVSVLPLISIKTCTGPLSEVFECLAFGKRVWKIGATMSWRLQIAASGVSAIAICLTAFVTAFCRDIHVSDSCKLAWRHLDLCVYVQVGVSC